MAAGDLSPDQRAFRDKFVAATGIRADVVTAWIGAESGWNITYASHNYLNLKDSRGLRTYPSVDHAVKDAAQTALDLGITARASAPPADLITTIGNSRWGTPYDLLRNTYNSLPKSPGGIFGSPSDAVGDAVDSVTGVVSDAVGSIIDIDALGRVLLTVALGGVFTVTALGLIVLGLGRITGRPVTPAVRDKLAAAAPTAAAVAAAV